MKNNMVKETKSELKKVIWPTRKTVLNGTLVVAVMVVLVGAIILVFDFFSSALVKKIISDDNFAITETDHTGHDHDHDHDHEEVENTENVQTPVEENSEPTIENNEVTE